MSCERNRLLFLSLPLVLAAAGCGAFGKVNQGRVVAYDRERGLITFIEDSNPSDPANPRYDRLPPRTVSVPANPEQMGPEPEPGCLLSVDLKSGKATVYDPESKALQEIPVSLVARSDQVANNDARVAGKKFPQVDRERKTVTIHLAGQRQLLTLAVPEDTLSLPDSAWKPGDEIRYYYKSPERALRLMNVTKTDIS